MLDLKEICRVYGKKFPSLISEPHLKMMAQVVPNTLPKDIPWDNVLTKDQFSEAVKQQDQAFKSIFEVIGSDISYYEKIYNRTKTVFDYLVPAKINVVKDKLYSMEKENIASLIGWKPNQQGFVDIPEYTLCESVTGRMKIKSGPNILLLQKKFRDIIVSRFGKDGSIWYLDYSSLEPRVALSVMNLSSQSSLNWLSSTPLQMVELNNDPLPIDIYTHALKKLKISTEVSREAIKQVVLSQLYGQAKSTTIETLEKYGVRRADEIVEMINEFFGIDHLRQVVLQAFQETHGAFLRTYYGRHLTPEESKPHALLNYFIQSTAVDVALMGFENILRRLKNIPDSNKIIAPIFLLHDALILDIHKSVEHLVPRLCNVGSKGIPGFETQVFHLTGNKL